MKISSRPFALLLGVWSAWSICLQAGTYKTITIDGAFNDWAGVPVAVSDPADATEGTDLQEVWVAHDADYLYLRFTLAQSGNPFLSYNNLFIDTDNDPVTGYPFSGIGSEMLIQGGAGYQEKNGAFNEGGVEGLDWAASPTGEGTQFEVRISRHAKFTSDSANVFNGDTIALVLEAENASYVRVDAAPDAGGLVYTLDAPPADPDGNFVLVDFSQADWRYLRTGEEPAAEWRQSEYDDTQSGWVAGRGLFGFTPNPSAYPLSLQTPFGGNATSTYFRTRFNWPFTSAGLSLLLSNYVSDGAAFYLNGSLVGSVRMPAGTWTNTTTATGPNPAPGVAAVVDIPPGTLITGENLLAVEVHQTAGDAADLVFGASLFASDRLPVSVVDAAQPADRDATEGEPLELSCPFRGSPPVRYQWLKNGLPIEGATNDTYTVPAVTQDDAGSYALRASNPYGADVTSRAAQITTSAVAVTFTDPALPADRIVTEGLPFELRVSGAGSNPVYQWYKNGEALAAANGASYSVASASLADAGSYYVTVSNRITAPVQSRTAVLQVRRDFAPPALAAVNGGPNRIVVEFSEPLDPVTATNVTHYQIEGGPAVGTASLSADNAARVILTTAAQTLGTVYTLRVAGVADRFGNAVSEGTLARFRSTIQVDGRFEDWSALTPLLTDPSDTTSGTDFNGLWVYSDEHYLYVRFSLYAPGDPWIFYNNVFIDTDQDPATGFAFRGIGSEVLVQSGTGYGQGPGLFVDGSVLGLDWAGAPEAPASEFEFRLSRSATFEKDGSRVFKGAGFSLVLETEDTTFTTVDTAPDADGAGYLFQLPTPIPPNPIQIRWGDDGAGWIWWVGAGRLQTAPAVSGPWSDVPGDGGAVSPARVQPGAAVAAAFYRLHQ